MIFCTCQRPEIWSPPNSFVFLSFLLFSFYIRHCICIHQCTAVQQGNVQVRLYNRDSGVELPNLLWSFRPDYQPVRLLAAPVTLHLNTTDIILECREDPGAVVAQPCSALLTLSTDIDIDSCGSMLDRWGGKWADSWNILSLGPRPWRHIAQGLAR